MSEATPVELLQQARLLLESVDDQATPQWQAQDCMLTYLEQRHADGSGPAKTPEQLRVASTLQRYTSPEPVVSLEVVSPESIPDYTREPKCKVCGCLAWSVAHSVSSDAHAFVPPDDAPADSDAVDINALQRLCDAASDAPWFMQEGDVWCSPSGDSQQEYIVGLVRALDFNDGAFIAAARDALPKLIARVRELEALLEVARPYVAMHQLRTGHQLRPGQSYSQGISAIEADDDDE